MAAADVVERHATKDPGMGGMLRRASVVFPKSGPQKKIALDTEQSLPPHTAVSCGRSPGTGARPNDTASNDLKTGVGQQEKKSNEGGTT